MSIETNHIVAETPAPDEYKIEELDVRQLGPPKPLSETLERLEEVDNTVLVQLNDRAPQHLYPKLADRGYEYETVESDGTTITIIWEE